MNILSDFYLVNTKILNVTFASSLTSDPEDIASFCQSLYIHPGRWFKLPSSDTSLMRKESEPRNNDEDLFLVTFVHTKVTENS